MDRELARFLLEIKVRGYDLEYASYHASNLIMQEEEIIYNVDLNNSNTALVLDFLIKLDTEPVEQCIFRRIIDDLVEAMSNAVTPDRTWLLFLLYKEEIQQMYRKYAISKISFEKLKASIRRYCEQKEDFEKLLRFAMKDE